MKKILGILLLLYAAFVLADMAFNRSAYQWDFTANYECTRLYNNGGNPYQLVRFKSFPYPPLVLQLFRPVTLLPAAAAFYLFLAGKVLLLALLLYLWHRYFLKTPFDVVFCLFCLLAFNETLYLDLRAGNVSIVEQALLWSGFLCFLRQRYLAFSALVVIAASLKLQPILFIFLLLFARDRNRFRYLAGSLFAFAGLLWLQALLMPDLFEKFMIAIVAFPTGEFGISNPALYPFFRELLDYLNKTVAHGSLTAIGAKAFYVYVVAAAGLLLVSVRALRKIAALEGEERERWLIFFSCFIYVIINFRFKDYSYIVLLLPAYYIMRHTRLGAFVPLLLISAITVRGTALPGLGVAWIVWEYFPLMATFLFWCLYLYEIHTLPAGKSLPDAV